MASAPITETPTDPPQSPSYGRQSGGGVAPNLPLGNRSIVGRPGFGINTRRDPFRIRELTQDFGVTGVAVTGVSSSGAVGNASVTGDCIVTINGVTASGAVGAVAATGNILSEVGAPSYGVQSGGGVAANLPLGNRGSAGRKGAGIIGMAAMRPTPEFFDLNNDAPVISVSVSVTGVSSAGAVGGVVASATGDLTVAVSGVSAAALLNSVSVLSNDAVMLPSYGVVSGGGVVERPKGRGAVGYPAPGLPFGMVVFNAKSFSLFSLNQSKDVTVSVSGVSSTAVLGSVAVGLGFSVPVSGVNATGIVNSVLSVTGSCNVFPVSTSSAVWDDGSAVWDDGTPIWDGSTLIGTVGTVSVSAASANVFVSGVSASGIVGNVTVALQLPILATGVSSAGAVGTLSVSGAGNTTVSGTSSQGLVGGVSVSAGGSISVGVSGVSVSGVVGTLSSITGTANVVAPSISSSALLNSAFVIGDSNTNVSGLSSAGATGAVSFVLEQIFDVTGVSAAVTLGNAQVFAGQSLLVSGVSASGVTGTVLASSDLLVSVAGVQSNAVLGIASVNTLSPQDINVSVFGVYSQATLGTVSAQRMRGDKRFAVFHRPEEEVSSHVRR